MQPGRDERLSGGGLALGDLVLVVREDEVDPAGVDSNEGPRWVMLIAEHSMCQPGRPSPIAVDHDGSPGFGPFHRAKSRTSSFAYSSASTRSPTRSCSGSSRASRP